MLPLLTRFLKPQAISKICLGLHFGREQVSLACSGRNDNNQTEIQSVQQLELEQPLFQDGPNASLQSALTNTLTALCKDWQHKLVLLQLAVPDTIAISHVFTLDTVPKSGTEQQALAAWRMSRELHLPQEQYDYRCQDLGRQGEQALLLVTAVDKTWLDCIHNAVTDAGLLPSVLDIAAAYRFNSFYGALTQDAQHGGLITLEQDYWSLQLWDAQGRPRFLRARWHEDHKVDDAGICSDVERHVRAYSTSHDGDFGHLFLLCKQGSATDLYDRLQQRMHAAPVLIAAQEQINFANEVTLDAGDYFTAAAAAMPR